ncbi:MAG: hypothetical protein RLW61_02520 [Gammaproteobacteria bacterium]
MRTVRRRRDARRHRARRLLWLWSLSLLLGVLQPCCDVFAVAEPPPPGTAQHDCGRMAAADADTAALADAGCDPAEHAGAADGPPSDPGDLRGSHAVAVPALPAIGAAPLRAPVAHAWRARGSPVYQQTERLRL